MHNPDTLLSKPLNKHTLLVVDDANENLELLRFLLSNSGFNVFTALSANEAKMVLSKDEVDCILLDVNMPVQDGFSFCKELRAIEKYKLLPILFLTSLEREVAFEEAMKNGGDDFINKPFNKKELIAKIKSITRIKDLQDELFREKAKYEKEMRTAGRVQAQLIPEKNFTWNGIKAETLFQPLFQVGGDFVDAWSDNKKLHIVIADCSGHGPSAALIGAMFKMQLFNLPVSFTLLERVKHIRKNLEIVLPEDYSITFCYAILDEDLKITYINGGHPSPILIEDGKPVFLEGMSSMIIGVDLHPRDEVRERQLKKGSHILFYTDGASEAMDEDLNMVSEEGMKGIFQNALNSGINVLSSVKDQIFKHCKTLSPEDDIAMVCISL